MITVDNLQNLDGTILIPTEQILYFNNSKLINSLGTEILISGSSTGGGGDPDPGGSGTPTEVKDLTLEYSPLAIDLATNNIVEVTQDIGQGNFNRFEAIITQKEFMLVPELTDHFDVMKIQMNVKTAGYQMVKILLFDNDGKIINFNRVDSDTVQSTLNNNIKIDISSSGFMLVTNATYELANVFNTDKMPIAGVGGWYALTSSTDINSSFTAIFSAPVTVAKVRIYRCGAAVATFNGGSDVYDVKFTDVNDNSMTVSVPKVDNTTFLTLDGFKESILGVSGNIPSIDSKLNRFNFSVSTDGLNFTDISSEGEITYTQNPLTSSYTAIEKFPSKNINSQKLYFKIPDADIPNLKNIKLNMWRMETI